MPPGSRNSIKPQTKLRTDAQKPGGSKVTPRKNAGGQLSQRGSQMSHRKVKEAAAATPDKSEALPSVAEGEKPALEIETPAAGGESSVADDSQPVSPESKAAPAPPSRASSPTPDSFKIDKSTNEWQTIMEMQQRIEKLQKELDGAAAKHAEELKASTDALGASQLELEEANKKLAEASPLPTVVEEGGAPATEGAVGAGAGAPAAEVPAGVVEQLEHAQDQLKAARAEVTKLQAEVAAKDAKLSEKADLMKRHETEMTYAVAQEALRGIEMMEKMEKSIEDRKGREMGMMSKLRMAMKETVANQEWEAKLAEVEAEAQEKAKNDAAEIEELRALLATREEHAHAADNMPKPEGAAGGAPAAAGAPSSEGGATSADGGEASAAAASAEEAEAEVEERKRVKFELIKAKTELDMMKIEERNVTEKLETHMARLQLHLQASDMLKDLHDARGWQHGPGIYFARSRTTNKIRGV